MKYVTRMALTTSYENTLGIIQNLIFTKVVLASSLSQRLTVTKYGLGQVNPLLPYRVKQSFVIFDIRAL